MRQRHSPTCVVSCRLTTYKPTLSDTQKFVHIFRKKKTNLPTSYFAHISACDFLFHQQQSNPSLKKSSCHTKPILSTMQSDFIYVHIS